MVMVIKRQKKARFRIYIYDLNTKKAKCISLTNKDKITIEDIKQKIIKLFKTKK